MDKLDDFIAFMEFDVKETKRAFEIGSFLNSLKGFKEDIITEEDKAFIPKGIQVVEYFIKKAKELRDTGNIINSAPKDE